MIISGTGATTSIIDGNNLDRVVHVTKTVALTITGLTIQNGLGENGGGILNEGTFAILNSAVTQNWSGSRGGGVYNIGGELTIMNSSIIYNTADGPGGGISNILDGSLMISNTVIAANTVLCDGGGIENNGSATIFNSTIDGSSTSCDSGGGILNIFSSKMIIQRSTVSNNSAFNNGGGIWSSSPLTITNSTISGNDAGNSGGGLFQRDGPATLNNTTITANSADQDADGNGDGGAVFHEGMGGTVTTLNIIIAGNADLSSTGVHPDCSTAPGAIVSQGYNLIGAADGCNWSAAAGDQVGSIAAPIEPMLGTLAENGGTPKRTHCLRTARPLTQEIHLIQVAVWWLFWQLTNGVIHDRLTAMIMVQPSVTSVPMNYSLLQLDLIFQ